MAICKVCKAWYEDWGNAVACATKKVTHDKGVLVGDEVKITNGPLKETIAKVINIQLVYMYNEKYWHTVGVYVKMPKEKVGFLTHDNYEPLIKRKVVEDVEVLDGRELDLE